jgi:hypothetical protein
LAFLDEDDDSFPVATEPDDRRLGPPDHDRQILIRRLVAIGVGVLVLILLLLGLRGCLNARKTRAFENYASDLNSVAAESKQISDGFFGRLENPKNLSPLQVRTEIQGDRGAANSLSGRVNSLDPPGEVSDAQSDIELAYQLRADGLTAIADKIGPALGKSGQSQAIRDIAFDMQDFLASDVIYRRARGEIQQVFQDQGLSTKVPESQFLPSVSWLDTATIAEAVGRITGAATSGTHAVGILQTTVNGTALSTTAPTSVTAKGPVALDVEVQNAGDSDESDVLVSYSVTGGTSPISGDKTIPAVSAGSTSSLKIPLEPAPPSGQQVTVKITLQPVVGQTDTSNTESTYIVTFNS